MIIDCISDLHGYRPQLPGGDLLIIAGDFNARESWGAYLDFQTWLNEQEYREIILVPGNHDTMCQDSDVVDDLLYEYTYLCDSGIEIEYHGDDGEKKTFKVWGSPWTKTFEGMNPECMAFTCDTEKQLAKKWTLIPKNTDILITHSPPFNYLDKTVGGKYAGSETLLNWIRDWKPRLHIFGHIHEAYGQEKSFFGKRNFGNKYGVTLINASHVNERYDCRIS